MPKGALYLIPVPLSLPAVGPAPCVSSLEVVHRLQVFVVENAKTARSWLKAMGHPTPLQRLRLLETGKTATDALHEQATTTLLQGMDLGLMSEAGCPAIADPGALLVRHAHRLGLKVIPLVGPSSILLALMASGLNGQRFTFLGYLATDRAKRSREIIESEKRSRARDETQVFIETPYRNEALLNALLESCSDDTLICVACDLTRPSEWIATRRVHEWRKARPPLKNRPAVFLLLSAA